MNSHRDQIITVPNGITLARAIITGVSAWLITGEAQWYPAFALLWLAALLDGADGYVARRFNQASRLGAALDPAVDRLAMAAIYLSLVIAHIIPVWLLAAIAFRDLAVMTLVAAAAVKRIRLTVSMTGKLATVALFLALPVFLLGRASPHGTSLVRSIAFTLTFAALALYYRSLVRYAGTVFPRRGAR